MIRLTTMLTVLLLLAAGCASGDGEGDAAAGAPATAGAGAEPTGQPGAEPTGQARDEPTGQPGDAGTEPPPAGEGLTAVSTVFPLTWIARQIAPGVEVAHLAAQGQDPHDLELTPGDRALLETADVVLYMGDLGFQPQVETAVGQRAGVTVSVRAVAGDAALLEFGDGHDDHGHDDDHGHGEYDPHVWFDAAVMAEVALAVGEAFAEADASGAEAYRGSARAVHDELLDLGVDLDQMLTGCIHETAIVSHEAYAYLLAPRGLHQEGISGTGGHGEASPQRLAALTRRIQEEGIPAVLAEPVEGRAGAEALAREAGVELVEIDPLEVAGEEAFALGYPALLRQQGEQFAHALVCSGGV